MHQHSSRKPLALLVFFSITDDAPRQRSPPLSPTRTEAVANATDPGTSGAAVAVRPATLQDAPQLVSPQMALALSPAHLMHQTFLDAAVSSPGDSHGLRGHISAARRPLNDELTAVASPAGEQQGIGGGQQAAGFRAAAATTTTRAGLPGSPQLGLAATVGAHAAAAAVGAALHGHASTDGWPTDGAHGPSTGGAGRTVYWGYSAGFRAAIQGR